MADRLPLDPHEVARLRAQGLTRKQVAHALGVSYQTVTRRLRETGIPLPGNRLRDITPEMVKDLYVTLSEKQIADQLGVGRDVIRRRLLEAGITPRNRSEVMFHRMAATTAEERRRLAKAAHDAVRGVRRSEDELIKRAQAQTRRIGEGEHTLLQLLEQRGVAPIHQMPVYKYNVDLAIPPVAVEVFRDAANPALRGAHQSKAKYLLDHHWAIVWVWITSEGEIDETTADQVIAIFKRTRRTPTLFGEEWVIGRRSNLPAIVQREGHKITLVPTPI